MRETKLEIIFFLSVNRTSTHVMEKKKIGCLLQSVQQRTTVVGRDVDRTLVHDVVIENGCNTRKYRFE